MKGRSLNILRNTATCMKGYFVPISPVRTRTGDALRCDLADEQTVTGTTHILLPSWSILYGLRERQKERHKEEKEKKSHEVWGRPSGGGVDFIFEDLLLLVSPQLCFME